MRDLTYPPVVLTARAAFKLLGVHFQMRDLEHIPRIGPAVLAYNHISYVDFIFGGYAAHVASRRRVRYMAKKEIFDHRVAGPLMRSLHHISVDRSEGLESYAEALRYLAGGEVVGMFPEATISYTYELKDIKSGAVRLAGAAGVPLIPVVLWGTQRMVPKGRKRDFRRGQTVAITVGEPMHPGTADPHGQTVELKARMSALLDQTIRAYPERPPGAWWLPKSHGGGAPDASEVEQLYRDERRAKIAKLRKMREDGKA